jgi:hypothetical protein
VKQFSLYPIYVVYSKTRDEFMYRQAEAWSTRPDGRDIYNWITTTGIPAEQIRPDADSPQSRLYETTVCRMLNNISSDRLGKMVLDSFPPYNKIYIHPMIDAARKECGGCSADTVWWNMNTKQGGGRRIAFSPDFDAPNAEYTLCHELVHAARGSNSVARATDSIKPEYTDSEEFAAHVIENMYRSSQGKTKLDFVYGHADGHKSLTGTKASIYQMMVNDHRQIFALKFLLSSDPLCARLSRLKWPDFNPFRDFETLQRLSINTKMSSDKLTLAEIHSIFPEYFKTALRQD